MNYITNACLNPFEFRAGISTPLRRESDRTNVVLIPLNSGLVFLRTPRISLISKKDCLNPFEFRAGISTQMVFHLDRSSKS